MRRSVAAAPVSEDAGLLRARRSVLDPARTAPWFAALLLLAGIAFWPTYLSRMGASSAYTHLHAAAATLWMALLVVQPLLVRTRRLSVHRALGRISYGVGPLVVLSVVLLAHSRIAGLEGEALVRQSYVLWLQVSLGGLFAVLFALAVLTRRTMALHARFMIATSFTLIDPIVVRLLLWAEPGPAWNYQWLTFALTDLVILALVWLDRDAGRGRWVFRALLPIFVLSQLPALLSWTSHPWWQAFAGWFAGLGPA